MTIKFNSGDNNTNVKINFISKLILKQPFYGEKINIRFLSI